MRYIIVTGMSGAGKTSAIHALEDLGYFCVDNLPPSLIPRFIELWKSDPNTEENAAFGVDIRSRQYFNQLALVLQDMREKGIQVEVLFLDCRDEELSRRYKTTRRIHPLQASDRRIRRLEQALSLERKYLAPMRERADYLIDTSDVNVWQTRQMIQRLFGEKQEEADCEYRSPPLGIRGAFLWTAIWCLTYGSCPIHIMWRRCGSIQAKKSRYKNM